MASDYPRVTLKNSAVVGALRGAFKAALPHTYAAVTKKKSYRVGNRFVSKTAYRQHQTQRVLGTAKSALGRGTIPRSAPQTARTGIFGAGRAKGARASFRGNYTSHKYNRAMAKAYTGKGHGLLARGVLAGFRGLERLTRGGKAPRRVQAGPGLPVGGLRRATAPVPASVAASPAKYVNPHRAFFNSPAGKAFHQANIDFNNPTRNLASTRIHQNSIEAEFRDYARKAAKTRAAKKAKKASRMMAQAERRAAKPKPTTLHQKVSKKQTQIAKSLGRTPKKTSKKERPVKSNGVSSIQSKVAKKQKQLKSVARAAAKGSKKGGRRRTAAKQKNAGRGFYYARRHGKRVKVKFTARGKAQHHRKGKR